LPVLLEMIVWSERYLEVSESGRALAQRIRSNREALIREITDNLKKAE
jgi:DNA-binding MarR family transcriptional regulator